MQLRTAAVLLALSLAACGGGSSSTPSTANVVPAVPLSGNSHSSTFAITEYSLGTTPSVGGIVMAPDGSIWTQSGAQVSGQNQDPQFVRWDNGLVTTYPLPLGNSSLSYYGFYGLGIMTLAGQTVFGGFQSDQQQEYQNLVGSVPQTGGTPQYYQDSSFLTGDGLAFGDLADLTSLSGGSVWQAISYYQQGVSGSGEIQEITPGNTTITLPTGQNASGFTVTLPDALAQGPDGNLWASEEDDLYNGAQEHLDTAMRVYSPSGTLLHSYPTPFSSSTAGMVTGPDHALWFTGGNGQIARMTVNGKVKIYSTNTTTNLTGIAVGADGALWFLEPTANMVGRITMSGTVTTYAIPTANSFPLGIAGPPPGWCGGPYVVWFAEFLSGKIAAVAYK